MKDFKDMKDFVDYITKSENLEEFYAEVVKNGEKEVQGKNYSFVNNLLNKQVYFNLQLLNFYKHKYGKVSLKELVEYTKNKE